MYFREDKKKIPFKQISIGLAVLVIILGLSFVVSYNRRINFETSFAKMIEEENYAEALTIYREVQSEATSLENRQNERTRFSQLQKKYEEQIANKTNQVLYRLEAGENLSLDDQAFIVGFKEVTNAIISPYLDLITENWLDQKISYQEWQRIIKTFQGFPNLQLSVENILNQEEELILAASKFKEVDSLDLKRNWEKIWEEWSALSYDKEIGRFASNYAAYRLQVFQDELYKTLMKDVNLYIEQQRFYSAKVVLDRLFDAYPNEAEIQEKISICNENIPGDLITWEDPIEVLAIKPLLVDAKKAKQGKAKHFAETQLISVNEFENILESLYTNNYILVSPNLYFNYPDSFSSVVVPRGKTPIFLIFDTYQYSARAQEAGTAAKLTYDPETKSFSSYLKRNDPESISQDNVDAVTVLESFLQSHPGFSFNGAKALISLAVDDSIFGYTYTPEQFDNLINNVSDLGLPTSYLVNMEESEKSSFFKKEKEGLKQVIEGLKFKNYYFCNGTYSGKELSFLDFADFKAEIDQWDDLMFDLIGETETLLFPNGAHVYADAEKLNYLTDKGYANFYSQGVGAFNYMTDDYIHFNYTPINGATLMSSDTWDLQRFMKVEDVLENWRN